MWCSPFRSGCGIPCLAAIKGGTVDRQLDGKVRSLVRLADDDSNGNILLLLILPTTELKHNHR